MSELFTMNWLLGQLCMVWFMASLSYAVSFVMTAHELLIEKFRLKLKKVGKPTRPFRYDLNHSPMIIQWR